MKKYNNFCITWNEDGAKHEEILFNKLHAIGMYLDMLRSKRDISSLAIYGVTLKNLEVENITFAVNRFLNN